MRAEWEQDGAVVKELAGYHQCGSGSIPGPGVICGLSLLFVLSLALRVFRFFLSPQKLTYPNSNFIRNQWTNSHTMDMPGCKFLSIYTAKLKTTLLKTRALRAANDFQQAVNALTDLQLISSRIITR